MLASILIIVLSMVLFVYWFRYTCILLLTSDTQEQYADRVARANRLSFLEVHTQLQIESKELSLDRLHRLLDRDYRILRYLLQHAAGLGVHSMEQQLLVLDYRVMQIWYWFTRHSSPSQARKALEERARILSYFAQKMGQRVASFSEA